ncbi:MAG: sulfite exporter TauE/SafE family protein, partial [Planctomycetota bacterium]
MHRVPHDRPVTGPASDSSARIRGQKPEQSSDCATPAFSGSETRTKKRALIFAGLLLLASFTLVAMFEQGLDSGIAARHLLSKFRSAGTDIGFKHVPALLLLGMGAGLFSGMLGQGGGVLKIAGMLLLFKLDIFFARAVSLMTMFFATASAAWPYAKRGFPTWRIIRPMLPPALAGLVGGVLLGNHLRGSTLACLFGFFVLFLGFYTLATVFEDPKEHCLRKTFLGGQLQKHHGRLSGCIGALHGFICGLLGISGGVISVPTQQLLLDAPARNAIANTLVVSALCSGLGSVIVIS